MNKIFKWVIAGIFPLTLVLLLSYLPPLHRYVFSLKNSDWILFRDYLGLVISWPVIILVIALFFMMRFQDAINYFLRNLKTFKAGPVDMTLQSQEVDEKSPIGSDSPGIHMTEEQAAQIKEVVEGIKADKEKIEHESEEKGKLIELLVDQVEQNEFSYLGLFLVQNTKQSLLWFHNLGGATAENFRLNYDLPVPHESPKSQKEIILSVLLKYGLLEQDGVMLNVSDKGRRFLKFEKLIAA